MVRKLVSFMVKLKPGRRIRSCGDPGCDIKTNKKYKSPSGEVYIACMFSHAEAAYARNTAATPAAIAAD